MTIRFRIWLTAATMILAALVVVRAATRGPDAAGYTATDEVVYSFVDIAGGSGGASVLSGVDDGLVPLTLPFSFRFYGQNNTLVCVSANGAVYFITAANACAGFSDFGNVDLSSTATPNDLPAALPFWTDLTFDAPGAGSVFYQTLGALGSRRFVIQWHNAVPQGSPNPVTFQVVFNETTHVVHFQYRAVQLGTANVASAGGQATVGVRTIGGHTNQRQIPWSFNAGVLTDQSAIRFSAPQVSLVGDVDGNGTVNCADLAIVRAAMGRRTGQIGFDPRADLNGDGLVSVIDLATVSRALPVGSKCP